MHCLQTLGLTHVYVVYTQSYFELTNVLRVLPRISVTLYVATRFYAHARLYTLTHTCVYMRTNLFLHLLPHIHTYIYEPMLTHTYTHSTQLVRSESTWQGASSVGVGIGQYYFSVKKTDAGFI